MLSSYICLLKIKCTDIYFSFLLFHERVEMEWIKKTFAKMLLICWLISMPKYTLKSQENFKEATKIRQNLELIKRIEKIIRSQGQLQWFFIQSIKFDTKIFQVLVGNYKKLVLSIPIICMWFIGIFDTKLIKNTKKPMKIGTEIGIFCSRVPNPCKYMFVSKRYLLVAV